MGKRIGTAGLMILLAALSAMAEDDKAAEAQEQLPPGVEQLLPRGRIAAITDPQFVLAAQAEIAEDAWVLGVVIEGQPKAYSLNLLNRHEVVNDQSGGTAFAAVW